MKKYILSAFTLFFLAVVAPGYALTAVQTLPTAVGSSGQVVSANGTYQPVASPEPKRCIPRPACLDAHPRCMIAEPIEGFCPPPPTGTITPTPMHCGGFIRNAPTCPSGYVCKLNRIADTGGTCVPIPSPTITPSVKPIVATPTAATHVPFLTQIFHRLASFFSFFHR